MHKQPETTELSQTRSLLALACALLQSDDTASCLRLIGQTLADLIHMESAIFVLQIDGRELVSRFGPSGMPQPVAGEELLLRTASDCLSGVRPAGASVLAVAIPSSRPRAALAARWHHADGGPDARRRLMTQLGELAVAALTRNEARASLESMVSRQSAQMADWSEVYADELARRDRVEDEIRTLSLTDEMTGLLNRRGFFVEAEPVFRVAQRQRAHCAVIFADIDGLKQVNDKFGHAAGDQLICDAAGMFQSAFRSADVVARLGGDEFVAFTIDDAHPDYVVKRIERGLQASNGGGGPPPVSLSLGIVQCDPDARMNLCDYVGIADQQMYSNKRRAR